MTPRARVGVATLAVIAAVAAFGPFLVGDPSAPVAAPLQPPSWAHLLGTTGQGQDVLAQTVAGARTTLLVGVAAGTGSVALGALVGALAGYLGGRFDAALSFATNVALVLPGLPLAVVLAAWLPPGPASLVAVLVLTGWAWNARVIRAEVLRLRGRDWVSAARLLAESPLRILAFELVPNLVPLLAAALAGAVTYAVGAQVGLEFLGLGNPGAVSWGTNLYWAANDGALLTGAWWTFLPSGLGVAVTGLALALVAGESAGGRGAPVDTPVSARKQGDLAENAPVLRMRGLVVERGGKRAVDGVDLELRSGEILGLAGESGSGKSTIALAVLRLLQAPADIASGAVHVEGRDVLALDADGLRSLRWRTASIVLQDALHALSPVRTVGDQLRDTLQAHGSTRAIAVRSRAASLLAEVGLAPELLDRYPHQLSGGQRQRVCIALALALRPRLLVLDEPTTALDVLVQREVFGELLRLRERHGFAMLLVSHDLPLLFAVADRVAVLKDGRVVEQGPVATMRAAPEHPYTRALLGAAIPAHQARPPVRHVEAPLVEVRGLGRTFPGPVHALRGVDLTLRRGESVAIVGESGSGKSTLARILCGLDTPTAGEVRLDGRPLLASSPAERSRRVQMVFQDPMGALNPAWPVERALRRALRLRGPVTDEAVASLLRAVDLDPALAGRLPHELSGGQRQRVVLARALAAEPDLLVADEPTAMLDVSLRAGVLARFAREAENGRALVLVTHDLAVASVATERTIVLYAGLVVEEGPTTAILEDPVHPYTKLLLEAARTPVDPGEASRKAGPCAASGCPFAARCPAVASACAALPELRGEGDRTARCHAASLPTVLGAK